MTRTEINLDTPEGKAEWAAIKAGRKAAFAEMRAGISSPIVTPAVKKKGRKPVALTVKLSIPPRELSPNTPRVHWAAKMRAVRAYRGKAHGLSRMEIEGRPEHKEATSQVRWFTKTKRRPDADNALSMLKSAFDGITDSGFLSNDLGLTHLPIIFAVDKENPRVEITITPNL